MGWRGDGRRVRVGVVVERVGGGWVGGRWRGWVGKWVEGDRWKRRRMDEDEDEEVVVIAMS